MGYMLISPGGPFPLMCTGEAFAGLGIAMQMAQASGFVGGMKKHPRLHFGILHACYSETLRTSYVPDDTRSDDGMQASEHLYPL